MSEQTQDVPLSVAPPDTARAVEVKLTRYLDSLVNDLIELMPKALLQGDEQAVHATRVATRRLKAAMDLVNPIVSKDDVRPFSRTLRKLRRSLGNQRDLDVMGGHLNDLARRRRSLKSAVQWLQIQLNAERELAKHAAEDHAPPARFINKLAGWESIKADIDASAGALDAMLAQSLHLQLDAFSEQSDQVVVQFSSLDPDAPRHDPHELRIAGKALRYTLEMAREQGHDLPGRVFKMFKALQEHLGLWHDFVVLADWCLRQTLEKQLSHYDPVRSAEVLEVSQVCLRKCAIELQSFGELWTTQGDEIAAAIRTSFPLTRPATVLGPPLAVDA